MLRQYLCEVGVTKELGGDPAILSCVEPLVKPIGTALMVQRRAA